MQFIPCNSFVLGHGNEENEDREPFERSAPSFAELPWREPRYLHRVMRKHCVSCWVIFWGRKSTAHNPLYVRLYRTLLIAIHSLSMNVLETEGQALCGWIPRCAPALSYWQAVFLLQISGVFSLHQVHRAFTRITGEKYRDTVD
jgi:hypothetical protein